MLRIYKKYHLPKGADDFSLSLSWVKRFENLLVSDFGIGDFWVHGVYELKGSKGNK